MSVRSFSEKAWSYALSTRMNPTNVTEKTRVEDKGSICKSIPRENNRLFTSDLKTTTYDSYLQPLMEGTARVVTFCAIQILVAPIGIVYNALAVSYCKAKNASDETTYQYLKACGSDSTMALIPLIAVFAYKRIKATSKNLTPNTQLTDLQKNIRGIYLALGSSSVYATLAAGLDPKQSVHILVWNENRTSYFKSIALYKDFGICAQDGSLLQYNAKEDTETAYFYPTGSQAGKFHKATGTLSDIHLSLKMELVDVLLMLSNENKYYPPEDMRVDSVKRWAESVTPVSEKTQQLLKRYKELDRNLDRVVALLQGSFLAQKTKIFDLFYSMLSMCVGRFEPQAHSYWDADINIPKYPSSIPRPSSYSRSNSSSYSGPRENSSPYQMAMQKIIRDIKNLDNDSNYNTDPLKNHSLATKLRQGQTTAAQILDLNSGSIDDSKRNRAYKKLTLEVHPDKNRGSKYSIQLFQALNEANSFLLQK